MKLYGSVNKRVTTIGQPQEELGGNLQIRGWRGIAELNRAANKAVVGAIVTKLGDQVAIDLEPGSVYIELCSPRRVEAYEIVTSFLDGACKLVYKELHFTNGKLQKLTIDPETKTLDIWEYIAQAFLLQKYGQKRWRKVSHERYTQLINAAAATAFITGSFECLPEHQTAFNAKLSQYKDIFHA